MILSGVDIRGYVKDGFLKIHPISDPSQFQQNGFDCRINSWEKQESIHPRSSNFYLAATAETFEMPDDLMALICLKSSWARKGFLVPSTVVDAGFKGNLTIAVTDTQGYIDEIIGKLFIHLIFAKTSGKCIPYAGKYQGQTGITGAR